MDGIHQAELSRCLFEESNDAFFIFDPDDNRILDANPTAEGLTGTRREQLLGKQLPDILRADGAHTIEELIRAHQTTGVFHSREGYRLRSAESGLLAVSVSRIHTTPKPLGLVVVRNITERKKSENALRLSEEQFCKIAENINSVFWLWDCEKKNYYVSPAFQKIWGRSSESVRQQPSLWEESLHPEDCARIQKAAEKGKAGEPYDVEYRIVRPDGSIRWIWDRAVPTEDAQGKLLRVAGIAEDITQRKQAEKQIRANNTLLEGLTHLQQESIIDADPRQSFGQMLALLLEVTASEYGFIGEVLHKSGGQPYLKTHAITNIAWNDETRAFYEQNSHAGLEFHNLDTLFGEVLTTGECVIANDATSDPRGGGLPPGHPSLHTFLGLPFFHADKLIGMAGLANRAGGYDERIVHTLTPILATGASLVHAYHLNRQRKQAEEALKHAHDELEHRVEERTAELAKSNRKLSEEIEVRKRTEQELSLSAEIMENMADGVNLIRTADRAIVYTNPRFDEMFGYDPGELIGKHVTVLNAAGEKSPEETAVETFRCVEEQGSWSGDVQNVRKDGTVFWTCANVSTFTHPQHGMVWVIVQQDITERKRIQESLLTSEARLSAFIDCSPAGMALFDDQLRYLKINATLADINGPPVKEHLGKTLREVVPQIAQQMEAMYHRILTTGEPVLNLEVSGEVPSQLGVTRHWICSQFRIPGDGPDTSAIGVIVVEITDRKRVEVELRRQQEELAHVARLSTMGEMATGLAHELNQPLAAISNYCYVGEHILAHAGSTDTEQLSGLFEKLMGQAIRAGEIIRRLRGLVGKKEPACSRVDVIKLIQEVLHLLESDLRENDVRVEHQTDSLDHVVTVDEIQIQQVLVNLIRNAVDAMSEAERDPRTLKITASQTGDDLIEVSVSDTGGGIPVESADQVFDAFFSSKSEGMGMGLAISQTIIESHGGRLWMTPNSDRGVTFHFTLPMEKEGR